MSLFSVKNFPMTPLTLSIFPAISLNLSHNFSEVRSGNSLSSKLFRSGTAAIANFEACLSRKEWCGLKAIVYASLTLPERVTLSFFPSELKSTDRNSKNQLIFINDRAAKIMLLAQISQQRRYWIYILRILELHSFFYYYCHSINEC